MAGFNSLRGVSLSQLSEATGGMSLAEIGEKISKSVTSDDVLDIVVLTQAEYDAITPVTGTLYFIEG